jgi:hypothetical protein
LTHKPSRLSLRSTIRSETKPLDMCMRECTVVAGVALDFADLNHGVVDNTGIGLGNRTTWREATSRDFQISRKGCLVKIGNALMQQRSWIIRYLRCRKVNAI